MANFASEISIYCSGKNISLYNNPVFWKNFALSLSYSCAIAAFSHLLKTEEFRVQ